MKVIEIPMIVVTLWGFCFLSGLGVPAAHADVIFGTPTYIGAGAGCTAPSVTADSLLLFADSNRLPGHGTYDIWMFTRKATQDDWGAPINLGTMVNGSYMEANPGISTDGLTLFFDSDRPGGQGNRDIWVTTWVALDGSWSQPVNLGPPLNSASYDGQANISMDGLSLFFSSDRPGGQGDRDTWLATRETINDLWSAPRNLGSMVNGAAYDSGPSISADGRVLFFGSARPGGYGSYDLWFVKRATSGDSWTEPVNLGPIVNSAYQDITPCVSADGSTLYFYSNRPAGNGLWQVPIIPVVDFNADGKVDLVDLVMLIDGWGTNKTLCDIGPMPWGDGKVDIEDLKVFMAEWEKENLATSGGQP